MEPRVSCIIPAWNEAERLPAVLAAVVGHPLVAEVIVVDDGSSDDTAGTAERSGARVLIQTPNRGKSAAVARGLTAAAGEVVLLLDADLIGLNGDHVRDLLEPVLSRRADVSISLRSNAPRMWHLIGLDYISGERAMPRSMLDGHLERIAKLRSFGLEVHLNRLWLSRGAGVAVVRLRGVESPSKMKKQGFWCGIRADARMMGDILRSFGVAEVFRQISRLRRARVAVRQM